MGRNDWIDELMREVVAICEQRAKAASNVVPLKPPPRPGDPAAAPRDTARDG